MKVNLFIAAALLTTGVSQATESKVLPQEELDIPEADMKNVKALATALAKFAAYHKEHDKHPDTLDDLNLEDADKFTNSVGITSDWIYPLGKGKHPKVKGLSIIFMFPEPTENGHYFIALSDMSVMPINAATAKQILDVIL